PQLYAIQGRLAAVLEKMPVWGSEWCSNIQSPTFRCHQRSRSLTQSFKTMAHQTTVASSAARVSTCNGRNRASSRNPSAALLVGDTSTATRFAFSKTGSSNSPCFSLHSPDAGSRAAALRRRRTPGLHRGFICFRAGGHIHVLLGLGDHFFHFGALGKVGIGFDQALPGINGALRIVPYPPLQHAEIEQRISRLRIQLQRMVQRI